EPEVQVIGLPIKDAAGRPLEETVLSAIHGTIDSIPRPRRRDPEVLRDAVRRAVSAAVAGVWGKEPVCTVFIAVVCPAMLDRLNHVAIAVPDLDAAASLYRGRLGTSVSAPVPLPSHGVTTIFVDLPNTRIELISPLGDASPISGFLERNPAGGIHHIC